MEERMTTTAELPGDMILSEIVTRLPVKSVVRFRCVCKQWNSFLKTPTFYNLHNTNNNNNQKLFIVTSTTTKPSLGVKFFSIDCEAPDDGFTSLTAPFRLQAGLEYSVLTSCNGMVCLGMKKPEEKRIRVIKDFRFVDLILWNPSTSEYKTLSKTTKPRRECNEFTIHDDFAMYYSCSEDDYRILRIGNGTGSAHIYSLRSDSWRKLVMMSKVGWGFFYCMPSVVLDENVFFLNHDDKNIWIIRFDTKTEKFTKMKTQFSKTLSGGGHITVDPGCFHLRVHQDYYDDYIKQVEVLRMNGDGEWTPMGTYSSEYDFRSVTYQPLHLMRSGNWLMHDQDYLYKVDTNMLQVKNKSRRKFRGRLNNGKEKMCITAQGKYIETFVSPNRYMQITPTS